MGEFYMLSKKPLHVKEHFIEHMTIYVFMTILFLTGVIFGAIIVNSMSFVQKQDLLFYLERFFGFVSSEDRIRYSDVFTSSYMFHVKYILCMTILGLSVIGLPVIWVLLFLKGLVIGFSVGFMVNQLAMKGFLLASAAIVPQNVFIIPAYIIAGTLAMICSLTMLRKLFSRTATLPMAQPFRKYLASVALLLVVALGASVVETFISSEAMQTIINSLL